MADHDHIIRWTPRRKAAVVAEFLCGLTMPGDIKAKYGVSLEELEDWCKSFQQCGLGGAEGYIHPADLIMITTSAVLPA